MKRRIGFQFILQTLILLLPLKTLAILNCSDVFLEVTSRHQITLEQFEKALRDLSSTSGLIYEDSLVTNLKTLANSDPRALALLSRITELAISNLHNFSFSQSLVKEELFFLAANDAGNLHPITRLFVPWLKNTSFNLQNEKLQFLIEVNKLISSGLSSEEAVSAILLKPKILEIVKASEISKKNSPRFPDNRSSLRITKGEIIDGLPLFGFRQNRPYKDFEAQDGKLVRNQAFVTLDMLKVPLEILLIERFDGREKEIIKILMSRSNRTNQFAEHGAWLITLKNGRRVHKYVSSGSGIRISGRANEDALWELLIREVKTYDEIQTIQFFHSHPGDPFLSDIDIKAISSVKAPQSGLLTAQANLDVHIYATAEVEGQLVTTHYGRFD